jgi:hypothetical protein
MSPLAILTAFVSIGILASTLVDPGAILTAVSLAILLPTLIGVILLVLLLLFTIRVVRTLVRMRRESARGRYVSAIETGPNPLTNFSRNGTPSDPLNLRVIATGPQLAAAFAAAGWYRADEIALITSIRITVDAILARKYPSAPVSNLYLYGRHQDYAFERPGSSVRQRDHVRFWNTGEKAPDGRPIWIGAASKDIAVKIAPTTHLPTHEIAPDVDDERAQVIHDLSASSWVIDQNWAPGWSEPIEMKNATGDPWYTDGRVAVLTLADVAVLAPLAEHVRSPIGARIAHAGGRLLRWLLPRSGRLRAHAQRQAERAKARVSAKKSDSE